MATFYSVWGPTNTAYRCYISESRSQNITNNTSTVSVTAYFQTQYGWPIQDANTHVRARVRGSNVIDKTYNLSVGVNATKNIGSGSRTLSHNADGTLSNSTVELLVNTRNTGLFNNTASGSISHKTIPRATTPSSGNFTTGSATSISLPRASSSFTHEVTYKVGSATGTISSSAGTSVSWTPAHSLGSQFKNATSATVTITVKTKNGSTTIGTKTMNKTLSLATSRVPTVSGVTFTEQNNTVGANIGAPVQGKSTLKATIAGSGVDGSTIPSGNDKRRVTINGTTYNQGAIIPMPTSGERAFTGLITDSRGRQGTRAGTLDVLPYTDPKFVTVHAYRSATKTGTESDDGKYLRIQLKTQVQSLVVGTQKNWHSIKVRTRPTGGGWSDRNTIANAGLGYDDTINVDGDDAFSDTTSYDIEITITDRVSAPVKYMTRVSTAIPALDLHGTSVGIGKYHEQGTLDVGPGGIFDDGIRVGGYRFSGSLSHASLPSSYPVGTSSGMADGTGWPNTWGPVLTIKNSDRRGTQLNFAQQGGAVQMRHMVQTAGSNSWGAWKAVITRDFAATQAQVNAGTDTLRYVTPATLKGSYDDTGWQLGNYSSPISNYNGTTGNRPKWRRINGITYIQGVATATANTLVTSGTVTMFTLPAGFRPRDRAEAIFQGSGMNRWHLSVNSSGTVTAARYGPDSTHNASVWLPFSLSFPADN